MEIHHHPNARPNPPERRTDGLQADLTRQNREGIKRTMERVQVPEGDRIELSPAARNLAKDLETVSEESAEHRQKIAELREQYLQGTLNSPDRVDRAAGRILGTG